MRPGLYLPACVLISAIVHVVLLTAVAIPRQRVTHGETMTVDLVPASELPAAAGGDGEPKPETATPPMGEASTPAPEAKPQASTFLTCVTLLERGDPEAHTVLAWLLQRFPNDAEGWREIGDALYRAGQLEAAAVALARAAKASDDPSYQTRLGATLQALGRTDEAIVAFRRCLCRRLVSPHPGWRLGRACDRPESCRWHGSSSNVRSQSRPMIAGPGSHWHWSAKICMTGQPRSGLIAEAWNCSRILPRPMSIWV